MKQPIDTDQQELKISNLTLQNTYELQQREELQLKYDKI